MIRNRNMRKRVFDATGGICAECQRFDAKGEADHLIPLSIGGEDRLENMQWLCKTHHRAKSKIETTVRAKTDRIRERAELTRKRKPAARPTP